MSLLRPRPEAVAARRDLVAWMLLVFLAGIAGQALLIGNPGYFSHDELQWGHAAWQASLSELPRVGWTRVEAFQYRPLTFNLWLLLSYWLFDMPRAFHALWVVLGTGNGLLLFAVLGRWGLRPRAAAFGAVFFLLGPVAAHVHGWTASLADLLWVGALLVIALLALGGRGAPATRLAKAGAIALLCTAGLLAKEAAVVIPGLCAVAWLLSVDRRLWGLATIASAGPVLAYLILRVAIIDAGASGTAYAWSLSPVPVRWLEYQLYPFLPTTFEPLATLWASNKRLAVAGLLCLLVHGLAFRAHWRLGLGLLLGVAAALGPVLLLGTSYAQYAYGASVVVAGCLAASAQMLPRGRLKALALGAIMLVSTWHGVNVQRQIHRVGTIQAVFSPQLAALAAIDTGTPLRLHAPPEDRWIYERLVHDVPGYRGVAHRRQAVIVGDGEPASHWISPSGGIMPGEP